MNHPLLKNHTIRVGPASYPKAFLRANTSTSRVGSQAGSKKELCPRGTIPIRRRFMDEPVRSVLRPSRHLNGINYEPRVPQHWHAVFDQRHEDQDMHGAAAHLNVWAPETEKTDFSLAQIWIGYNAPSPANDFAETIDAGWMVYPRMYHDYHPRFFIFFTKDGYRTGCYNLDCVGFVQTDRTFTPGVVMNPMSVYNGPQYEIELSIAQHQETRDWWLYFNDVTVGYWPANLFPGLTVGANVIQWGGEVAEHPDSSHPTHTKMGSGHFAEEGTSKAAYFKEIVYLGSDFHVSGPDDDVETIVTKPLCYHITNMLGYDTHHSGFHFFLGGPGSGSCGCTRSS